MTTPPDNDQPIYSGRIIDVGIEKATLPDGSRVPLEIVRHPGGAAVAAIDDDDRICLLRQYRHAVGGWIWELPAGKLDNGEDPLVCAQRELLEEAGVVAADWQPLGEMFSSPGFCDERLYLFRARDLELGTASPEIHEHIEVHWVALEDAAGRARRGEIEDAKTVIGILRA